MSSSPIKTVDYYEFRNYLQKAKDTGKRIEARDRQAWKSFVREQSVAEILMDQWAKSRYESYDKIILDIEGEWRGYYVYCEADETVIKWIF